jgi:hypothetical protein
MRLSPHNNGEDTMLYSFDESTNAPGAQQLADRAAVLKDADPLQIRTERPSGSPHRVAAIMSKGCDFPAIFTFCHDKISFPAIMLLSKSSLQHATANFTINRIFFQ